ncbi:MAG: hypothetical protein QGG53_33780 [Planctomycetota bacterium]|jgi:hypothetical protein|nr:hypothetical protein [Planctomycetota bacterium]|tara:strand:- start:143 stop:352 length:210 start_codon:yes stop_codon:yes gene_type:complete
MSRLEKTEAMSIVICTIGAVCIRSLLPQQMQFGSFVLALSVILEMGPWRVRRERGHLNIVFAWRPYHPS